MIYLLQAGLLLEVEKEVFATDDWGIQCEIRIVGDSKVDCDVGEAGGSKIHW